MSKPGNLPDQWEKKCLGNVAEIVMGQSPPSRSYNQERVGLPFFQGKSEFGAKYPQIRLWCSEPSKVAKPQSILFCVRAPVGDLNVTPWESCIGRGLASIKAVNADSEFIYQLLLSLKIKFQTLAQGTTFEAISGPHLKEFNLLLPPLPEQKKIAAILSSVDEVIEKTEALIDKLKNLKKAMMQELLTKGIGHTKFKDSPVGTIPEEWEVGSLNKNNIQIIDGDRGKEYPKAADYSSADHCLFLSAKNVTKEGFKFDERTFISREKDERLGKGRLIRQDFVLTTRGTVGNIAFYNDSIPYDIVRINSGMAIIRNQSKQIKNEYLNELLRSSIIKNQIDLLTFGSAQPQLTIGLINNFIIPIPSLKEQENISKKLFSIRSKVQLKQQILFKIKNLKKALMHDLLTGKVRVKV